MMQQDKYIAQYVKNVKKSFPWGYPNKKNILKELKCNLKLFFDEHQDVSYEDLCINFGTPDSYIESIMSFYSPDELRKNIQLKKRKYFIIGLIISIIVIALICSALFVKHFIEKNFPATISNEIIIENEIVIEDEIIIEDEHIIND